MDSLTDTSNIRNMTPQCSCYSCGFSAGQILSLRRLIEQDARKEERDADPLRGLKVAITIDDLFLWKGVPWPDGYSPSSVTKALVEAFAHQGLQGIHAFTATAPAADDPKLLSIFDDWVGAGHHVGNHTHFHSNLNWVSPQGYIRDIELGEKDIARWLSMSSVKYFRYGQDGWGNTREKYDEVQAYLKRNAYQAAPISAWFYDTEFIAPHVRCIRCGDADAIKVVQDAFVETAVQQLRSHARLAAATLGRTPPLIFLMHATPLAQDCAERVIERLVSGGVEFVSLDTAMQDPFNSGDPGLITPKFYNKTQKWAATRNLYLEECPPSILERLDSIHPQSGPSTQQMMTSIFEPIAREVGGTYTLKQY
jgi:peptidoglycan/xylan/chitin deacetylase (PgdA/CDA1 family)